MHIKEIKKLIIWISLIQALTGFLSHFLFHGIFLRYPMFFDPLNRYLMVPKSKSCQKKRCGRKLAKNDVFFEIIFTFKLITLFFRLCYMFCDLLNRFSMSSKSKKGPQTNKKPKFSHFMAVFRAKIPLFSRLS